MGKYTRQFKTINGVRCRDLGSEESTREEVGCGGNEDVKMDEWSHQLSWTELGMKGLEGHQEQCSHVGRLWDSY